jgi:hypothetical protein
MPLKTPNGTRSWARMLPFSSTGGASVAWLKRHSGSSHQHGGGRIEGCKRTRNSRASEHTRQQKESIVKNELTQATWCLRCYPRPPHIRYQHVLSCPNANQIMQRPGRLTFPAASPANSAMSWGRRPKSKKPMVHQERHTHTSPSSMLATTRSGPPLPFPTRNRTDAELAQWYHRDQIFNKYVHGAQNKPIHAVLVQVAPTGRCVDLQTTDKEGRQRTALCWSWSRSHDGQEAQEVAGCFGGPDKIGAGRPGHHGDPHHSEPPGGNSTTL